MVAKRAWLVATAFAVAQVFAGGNLILNGTFDDVTVPSSGSGTGTWGAYSYAPNFQCANWEFYNLNGTTRAQSSAGLCVPSSTWTAMTAAQIGSYGLFVQSSKTSGASISAIVEQHIGQMPDGIYRVEFLYATRPSNGNLPTYVEFSNADGSTFAVATVQTSGTGMQTFSKNISLSADDYTFRIRQPGVSADKSNIFEGFSVRRCDAVIGENGYLTLEDALIAADAEATILWEMDAAGNASLSSANLTWNGNMPTVQVPGTLTFQGSNTIATYGNAPGVFTLFSADAISLASGATLSLDAPVTDGLVRTLNVSETAVTLVVALDPNRTEMVINGDFDLPGMSTGTIQAQAPSWSYAYPNGGFAIPYWDYYTSDTVHQGYGCGISEANGTWLAANQTNGGRYSFYGQREVNGIDALIRQNFGATPAGVYRFSFNYATRGASQAACIWNAKVLKDGATIHSMKMGEISNTVFANKSTVIAIGSAGSYGLAFAHLSPNTGDRTALIDDIHFTREAVGGWSVADGVTTLSGTAEVPAQSFVDGDAEMASGTVISTAVDRFLPSLRVDGTLTVKGTVTITLPNSYTTEEGTYKLVEAKTLALEDGASFMIDPACKFKDVDAGANYAYVPELITTANAVILHLYNLQPSGNNYYKAASGRTDDFWNTASNWERNHVPASGDGNVLFNHPGTVVFDGAYANSDKLLFFFRNGMQAPVVFDATDDAFGYDFNSAGEYFRGAQGNGVAGWVDFHRGTYSMLRILLTGPSNTGYESVFRFDVSGATVSSGAMQCGYSVDALTDVNISAGTLTISDYNPNITARTMNRTRVTGGKFVMTSNLQACSGQSSVFDCEVTGGEVEVRGTLNVAYTAANSRGNLRLSGGLVRANNISAPVGFGTFLFDGGTLAPYATSSAWLDGTTLTVAAGKNAVVDTEGKDIVWAATLADDAGGNNFGFTKRGDGIFAFAADQTFTGALAVEGGTFMVTKALVASGASVAQGATLSVADGTVGQAVNLAALAPAGGARLAIDLDETACDRFVPEVLDLSGASAANPVVIVVSPLGLSELPVTAEYTVIAGGLAPAYAGKFTVNGVDALVGVKNGALVLTSSNREKVTAEWSGAANDGGKWTTAGNWTDDIAPQNGDTAAFNLASGGITDFDIGGLALGGIVFGQTAGAFTHAGADPLRVVNAVTNLSAATQTFTVPMTIGVEGKSAEVNTAGDLVLTGATTIAAATLVKKGAGTLAVPGPTALTASRIEVEEGTLRIDERVATTDSPKDGAIVVKDGARLDVNSSLDWDYPVQHASTRSKTVSIQGNGPDGAGALYNSNVNGANGSELSRLILTGDAKAGGGHVYVRALASSEFPESVISGHEHTLTVDTGIGCETVNWFGLAGTALDLARIDVNGYLHVQDEITGSVADGVHFKDGSNLRLHIATLPATVPIIADAGANVKVAGSGSASKVNSTLTIGEGATMTATASQPITFYGPVTNAGTFVQASGNVYFNGPSLEGGTYTANGTFLWFGGSINSPESEITIGESTTGVVIFGAQLDLPDTGLPTLAKINATTTKETRLMPRAPSMIDGDLYDAVISGAANFVYIDSVENAATVTVKNATWNLKNTLYLGANDRSGHFVVGDGAVVTVPNLIYTAYSSAPKATYIEVARGGTLNWTQSGGNGFHIGRGYSDALNESVCYPHRVSVTGGTLNADNGTVLVGVFTAFSYFDLFDGWFSPKQIEIRHVNNSRAKWIKAHEELFTQKGGVFALGSGGMRSSWPNWEKPHADLQGGVLRPRESFSNKFGYMNIQFGASPASPGEYAIELNGKDVAWNAPLLGASEVTIQGEGKFSSSALLQSIPLGRWNVTGTTQPVDLSGAAGFADGLNLADGTSATLSIEGEGLVEWAMFNSDEYNGLDALKGFTGICPYVATTLAHLHIHYANDASKPMGSNSAFIYRGQFFVEEAKAGTWCFAGDFDDNIYLEVDGTGVFTGTAHNVPGAGSIELAAGWHDFRVIARDGTGEMGPWIAEWQNAGFGIGWTTDASAAGSTDPTKYTKFDTSTLKMRLPQSAASRTGVRMRVLGAWGTGDKTNFANDDLVYSRLDCVTNTLAGLNKYGNAKAEAEFQSGTCVRFEGCFHVSAEDAGEWTFYGHYDDLIALDVDGTRLLATTSWGTANIATGTRSLDEGWHSFRISAVDGDGGWGAYSTDSDGRRGAIRVKRPNGEKTLTFDETNFRIAYSAQDAQKFCAAGLGGVTTLGEGSTLSNRNGISASGACPIYGTLAGSGALDGFFRFTGEASAISVTGNGGRLSSKPNLDDVVNGDCLKGLAKVEMNFPEAKPNAARYDVCAAGDLTAEEAALIAVSVKLPNGDVADDWKATVVNGRLSVKNPHPGGCVIYFR